MTDTSGNDPGAGNAKLDTSGVDLAMTLYINEIDGNGNDISGLIASINSSTSTIPGHIKINSKNDPTNFVYYAINTITDNGTWYTISISYISGDTGMIFTNVEDVVFCFARTGDKGDTGATGATGSVGPQGFTGPQGSFSEAFNQDLTFNGQICINDEILTSQITQKDASGIDITGDIRVAGDVTADGFIQSGNSIIVDGTTPGDHKITTTQGENLTIKTGPPGMGGDLNLAPDGGKVSVQGSLFVTDGIDGSLSKVINSTEIYEQGDVFKISIDERVDEPILKKLVAMDGVSNDNFGYSVSISSDGQTAIIGAYFDDDTANNSGSAYIFERDANGNWTQNQKLVASDRASADEFGRSVSISGDGKTAIIGAHLDDDNGTTNSGSAYIFERDANGNWGIEGNLAGTRNETQKLVAIDGASNDEFGWSVSISGDGKTVIIGAYLGDGINPDTGSAYIFERDGSGNWIHKQKLVASDGISPDLFGYSVSISGDGQTAIIGSYRDDTSAQDTGSAYIFERDGSGNWGDANGNENHKLVAGDRAFGDRFGGSVSISSDGKTAIIGAYSDDGAKGSAYIFEHDGIGNFIQKQKLVASDGVSGDNFGISVSISSDGQTAIIGAYYDDDISTNEGSAYIFERDASGNWGIEGNIAGTRNETQKLVASDGASSDYFGNSVSMSGDGKTVIIGAYGAESLPSGSTTGSAYIFELFRKVYFPLGIVKQDTDSSGNTQFVTSGCATVPGVVPGYVYYYNPLTDELNSVLHGTAFKGLFPTDTGVSIMGRGIATDTLLVQLSYINNIAAV